MLPDSRSVGTRRRSGLSAQQPRRRTASTSPSGPRLAEIWNSRSASVVDSLNESAFQAVASALKAKDPHTWGHTKRVGAYASGIARILRMAAERIAHIRIAEELHDVGKIGVPERLLRKCSCLTANEYRRVMEHPGIGEQILRPLLPDGHPILGAVRWHHERLDGQGGPDGLSAADIPLAARIIAVADAFDAMTSARPYRAPMPLDVALTELYENAGSQVDPACVLALRELYPSRATEGSLYVAVPA